MRLLDVLLGVFLLVALLGLTGVLFRGISTADGLVLGVPSGLAWVTGWAVLTFAVLVAYNALRPAGPEDGSEEGPARVGEERP